MLINMRRLAYVIITLFSVVGLPLSAQDTVPWLPDPTIIFEPRVEIIKTDISTLGSSQSSFPWDDEKRLIYIKNSESGEINSYPYPKEFKSANWPSELDNGKWLIPVIENVNTEIVNWVWILDTKTGSFSRYVALCGQTNPLFVSDIIESDWIISTDYRGDNHTYLCEIATGKLSVPLPDEMEWQILDGIGISTVPPFPSPDGEWIAMFAAEKSEGYNLPLYVYSYNTLTGQLNELGNLPIDKEFNFQQWVGNQILIYTGGMIEWSNRRIYIADVEKPQSLEYAVGRGRYRPDFHDNPPRFEFVSGTEGYDGPHNCTWVTYTIETRQLITHDLGKMCNPDVGNLGEDAYYRDLPEITEGKVRTASLVRFNALTGERKELYAGEIESAEWISEDERFALLTLDTSGGIDRITFQPSYLWNLSSSNMRLAYVDLVNKRTLFDIPAYWDFDGDTWALKSSVRKIDENTFLAISFLDFQRGYASLFSFDGKNYVEKRLVDDVAIDMGRFLLIWDDEPYSSSRMGIYDIETGNSIPIIRNVDTSMYTITIDDYASIDNMIVTVSNVLTQNNSDNLSVRYTVKIPPPAG